VQQDLILHGPLGRAARQMTAERNLRSEIVYVAALSLWSAAIAPTVRIKSQGETRPPTVWTAMISPGGGWDSEWLKIALKALGSKSALPHVRIHPNIHTRHTLQRACKADGRLDAPQARVTSILGGSPFSSSRLMRTQLAELEPYLRPAWDRGWIAENDRAFKARHRHSLGVLWEISPREWEAKSGMLNTATRSRFLCFNIPANRYAHRNHFKGGSTNVEQLESHPMAQAIEWIRNKHTLELDEAGAAAWDVVRLAERTLESALGLERTCRIGEHTLRAAAALAAAECSTSIGQRDVVAAWTFVRQAIKDTCEIEDIDTKIPLDDLLANTDTGILAASESTEILDYAPSKDTSELSIISSSNENAYFEATASRFRTTTRIERERDTWKVRQVKKWYDDHCQMCSTRLELPPPARAVSEGAHIQALGGEHQGPDTVENILCLCPNCHTLFDLGARYLTDTLEVIDAVNGKNIGPLARHPQHRIGVQYVRSHRARWNVS
jgi:hypothetical protein